MSEILTNIQEALSKRATDQSRNEEAVEAAVAAILRTKNGELELLLIHRSQRNGDPWSGHLAFPGGRIERCDDSARQAAERETLEEIGISLEKGTYLGALQTLTGLTLPVSVSAFAYHIERPVSFEFSDEVQSAHWIPFKHLTAPEQQTKYTHQKSNQRFEAIDVLGPDKPLLWGITYRFTQELLSHRNAQSAS